MVTQSEAQKRHEKRDKIINLTDTGRHNSMHVRLVRNLEDDGTYRMRQMYLNGSLVPEETPQDPNILEGVEGKQTSLPPVIVAHEDKGSGYGNKKPYQPPEIETGYEEYLENMGATVLSSVTYYPDSRITTNKRSMTHDEIADERGYLTR
jgi:hypothetical protein